MGEGYSRGLEPLGQLRWLAYDEASWELRGLAIEYREGRGGAELVELVEEAFPRVWGEDFLLLLSEGIGSRRVRFGGHAFYVQHGRPHNLRSI